jgi:bla regulator protein BlaR1
MDFISKILSNEIIEALGLTILHSLWQGALIAILLGIFMLATNKFTSGTRYILAVTASLFMLICPVYTFVKNYNPGTKYKHTTTLAESSESATVHEYNITEADEYKIASDNNIFSLNPRQFKSYFYRHFPLIVTVWLLGILAFTLRFIGGLAYMQRLKYYRISKVSAKWQKKFKELCNRLNIKKTIKIYESTMAKVPMVIGIIKPVILLPVSAFTGLSPKQLESIIVHELAHIIRRDYLVNLLQSILEILFFYHPAVWWINGVIREERENCCDDIAIEKTGDSASYAKALANIQEQLLLKENLAMAIAANKNRLLKRIKRLLNQPKMKTNFIEGFTASCIIFLGIFAIVLNSNAISEKALEKKMSKSEKKNEILVTQKDELKGVSKTISAELQTRRDTTSQPGHNDEKNIIKSEEESPYIEEEKVKYKEEKVKYKEEKEKYKKEKASLADEEITEEIIRGIEQGIKEMDIDLIVDEAIAGAQAGLNSMDLNAIVKESLEASREGIEDIDVEMIINEILIGIQAALEEMDLNVIVGEAMNGVREALKEIEIEHIAEIEDYDDEINYDCETFVGNKEHLNNLMKGVDFWNIWRSKNRNEEVDLRGACLKEAELPNINLSNAYLQNVNFGEAILDGADFTGANLEGANLKEASLKNTKFKNVNLARANLKEVTLREQDFSNSDLSYINLKEAQISEVDFSNSVLVGANLKEASISEVDFGNADLSGANLGEASIHETNFKGATASSGTIFPPGFNAGNEGIKFK